MNGKYKKTAVGENLEYQSPNLFQYKGKDFCLRITVGDAPLDSCFFVYLPESMENMTLRELIDKYFRTTNQVDIGEMELMLDVKKDDTLLEKYKILRTMFGKVADGKYSVNYHINHGPDNVPLSDRISSHLGTSVWENGEYNDKILDLVLNFHQIMPFFGPAKEQVEWEKMGEASGSDIGWTKKRIAVVAGVGLALFGGWYFFIHEDDFKNWKQTDAALGVINMEDVKKAFMESRSYKDFCERVNKIYEGDELILVNVTKPAPSGGESGEGKGQASGSQSGQASTAMVVEGWADLQKNQQVDKEKDEKLFTIVYEGTIASIEGHGANSCYDKTSFQCRQDIWNLEKDTTVARHYSGGNMYYFGSSYYGGYWSSIQSGRDSYRSTDAYKTQLQSNAAYGQNMKATHPYSYDKARSTTSAQRQNFLNSQRSSGAFKNSYAFRNGGTCAGGKMMGGGI